ncbi:sugar phosphate isomerase/epimerase family protein [Oleidesulfovibrio sp.]|uniref:sugar phosphate isomerase/epimerase family protein n=1 Tax=Oleidesulfovibrio sp. TaxID=2909707 RepID=UPI003A8588F9
MRHFVNLPLSFAAEHEHYIDFFMKHKIHPEFGMDTVAVQELTEDWHRKMAVLFQEQGLECTVHLPFFDLHPGSLNDGILEATRQTLRKAAQLAALYRPVVLVGHPAYDKGQHPPHHSQWLKRSAETWQMVQERAGGVPLRLENTYEVSPHPLAELVDLMDEQNDRVFDVGICFDIGHWFSFGQGQRYSNLDDWLDAFGARVRHLHLHDNDGTDDLHLGLASSLIPLEDVFAGLESRGVKTTVTLEPHTEEDFEISKRYLSGSSPAVAALRRIAV